MDANMLLTIFTPTYNRAQLIARTFESLMNQSFKDFEWLIVDDGSTDETEVVVKAFQVKAVFPIRYIKKANGGKHTAYNVAITEARGEFFFTVDSDDWLPDNSLGLIAERLGQLSAEESVIGLISLKEYPNTQIIGKKFIKDYTIETLRGLEISGQRGERSLIFRTQRIRNYPFPIIPGERFMTESIVYDNFIDDKLIVTNDVLTTCEYQSEGLSSSPRKGMIANPGGFKLYFRNRIDQADNLRQRLGYIVKYNLFHRLYKGTMVKDYQGRYSTAVRLLNIISPLVENIYVKRASK